MYAADSMTGRFADPPAKTDISCQCRLKAAGEAGRARRKVGSTPSAVQRRRAATALARLEKLNRQTPPPFEHCYEAKERAKSAQPNNGLRPHGGYRGMSEYPPSPLSFDKPSSHHAQISVDLVQLLSKAAQQRAEGRANNDDDSLPANQGRHMVPSLMSLRESYKSYLMESFQHDAHLHTRLASRAGHLTPHSGLASRTSLTGRSSRMHEFLTATELAGSTAQELKSHLGKATRTTLLRNRELNRITPKEIVSLASERLAAHRKPSVSRVEIARKLSREIIQRTGESSFSFLVGANYNSVPSNRPSLMLPTGGLDVVNDMSLSRDATKTSSCSVDSKARQFEALCSTSLTAGSLLPRYWLARGSVQSHATGCSR